MSLLLRNPLAERLYHDYAETLPLIDYHNHIPVDDLTANTQHEDAAVLWLLCDPYKHRALRICGVDESFITGSASHYEKFEAWCAAVPRLIGNPLYHWSQLELARYFGIDTAVIPVNRANAPELWERMNASIAQGTLGSRDVLSRSNAAYVAPCTALTDSLDKFTPISEFTLAPSLRLDGVLTADEGVLESLESLCGTKIISIGDYQKAVRARFDLFEAQGCRIVDVSLDDGFHYAREELSLTAPVRARDALLAPSMLRFVGRECMRRDFKLLLHMGSMRDTSRFLRSRAGKTGGFAGAGNPWSMRMLAAFFQDLEDENGRVPSTLLFGLNPADSAAEAVLTGSFAGGRVGMGPPWWWNDHLQGMKAFFDTLSAYSVLSAFFGMTTDSRSVLSMVRHDYFRRTLCAFLAEKADAGEFPADIELLGDTVYRMSWGNAADFFHLKRVKP